MQDSLFAIKKACRSYSHLFPVSSNIGYNKQLRDKLKLIALVFLIQFANFLSIHSNGPIFL